jgi:hypothetical protein
LRARRLKLGILNRGMCGWRVGVQVRAGVINGWGVDMLDAGRWANAVHDAAGEVELQSSEEALMIDEQSIIKRRT